MSQSPYSNFEQRFSGSKLGNLQFEDMLQATLTDQYTGSGMGMTAEKLSEQYSISREEQDAFAVESNWRAAKAVENGLFAEEIIAVEVKHAQNTVMVDKDEHIRPDVDVVEWLSYDLHLKKRERLQPEMPRGLMTEQHLLLSPVKKLYKSMD